MKGKHFAIQKLLFVKFFTLYYAFGKHTNCFRDKQKKSTVLQPYMPRPDCPGLSGTVLDIDTLSRHPGKYEIVPAILKTKVYRFFKTN